MTEPFDWDQATPYGVEYESIPVVIWNMKIPVGTCSASRVDARETVHYCLRNHGHAGRHLAGSYSPNYVTAVWP